MRRLGEELGLGAGGRAVPGPPERVPLSSPPSQRPLSCLYDAFVSCLSGKSKSRQKRETTPLHKHPNRHPRSSQPCAKIPRLCRWVKRRSYWSEISLLLLPSHWKVCLKLMEVVAARSCILFHPSVFSRDLPPLQPLQVPHSGVTACPGVLT